MTINPTCGVAIKASTCGLRFFDLAAGQKVKFMAGEANY
jgi:hypothetical protein